VAGRGYTFSHIDFMVRVKRPGLSLIFQKFFPLALVIAICLGALFLGPRTMEGRLNLVVPGLVAAVALQLTTENELPPRGGILLIDEIFVLAYIIIVLLIAESLLVYKLALRGESGHARRIDFISLIALGVTFFGGAGLLIALR
jgi:hypothetical protein